MLTDGLAICQWLIMHVDSGWGDNAWGDHAASPQITCVPDKTALL